MKTSLRKQVIQRYSIPVNNPKDCELLSKGIYDQTGRSISPTTLRRFFGLLKSESTTSNFCLDTLSIYCGFDDYRDFQHKHGELDSLVSSEFHDIYDEMHQISLATLSSIKRKSLTIFTNTIPRKSINKRLNVFLESDYSVFPLIAPGGYGKSIALAHWISELLETSTKKQHILLCESTLFHKLIIGGTRSADLLNLNLSIPGNLFQKLLHQTTQEGDQLILVIDSIDELSPQSSKIKTIVNFIGEAVAAYSLNKNLKIILGVRGVTWNRYVRPEVENWNPTWLLFPKTENLEVGYSNIPLLTNSEVKEILGIFNNKREAPVIYECLDWEMKKLLRIPINLYLHNSLISLSIPLPNITSDRLIREFVNANILKSINSEEKADIIWKIINLSEKEEEDYSIRKNDLKDAYPIHLKKVSNYYDAYNGLLSAGILLEEKSENRYGLDLIRIRFSHLNFYFYFSALYLVKQNDGIDFELLNRVCCSAKNYEWKTSVIAFLYQMAYCNEDYNAIEDFCELPEDVLGSLPVRLAVGSSYRIMNPIRDKLITRFALHPSGQVNFFECFVDTNYLFNNYLARINEYLKHKQNTEAQLFGHCISYLGYFLNLDREGCIREYALINAIEVSNGIHPWPTGRKVWASLLHKRYIEGKLGNDVSRLIDPYREIAYAYPNYLENGVIEFEMYIMFALIILGEYKALIRLVDIAIESYPYDEPKYKGLAWMNQHQNDMPLLFRDFALLKSGYNGKVNDIGLENILVRWEMWIDNFACAFDDYQYLILIHYFLSEIYPIAGKLEKAVEHHQAALHLANFAEYQFYIAFLLQHAPSEDVESKKIADNMIVKAGFKL